MTKGEFEMAIARLQPTLKSLTHRLTFDRDESCDLVQETVLKALLYRDKFSRDTNLKGWLFTIMRNTYINQYRKTKRVRTVQGTTRELHHLQVEDSHTFNRPQERAEFKEIWHAVHAIREDLLVPFKMHLSGYKYEEIAGRLSIPIGTVKNRIFNARKEIQKKLQGYR